jgi:ADP-ribose pyrophosphatase
MDHQIKKKTVQFRTNLFTVEKVDLVFPDGRKRSYDLVDIQNAVTILPIDDQGDIYLVKQYRIGAEKLLLELPAGKVEAGEDPLETARREVREETGMAAREMIPLGNFYMTPGYANEYMFTFLARGLEHDPLTPDADEFLNLVRLPIKEVFRMVENKEIEDSKTLAVLMLAQRYLRVFR